MCQERLADEISALGRVSAGRMVKFDGGRQVRELAPFPNTRIGSDMMISVDMSTIDSESDLSLAVPPSSQQRFATVSPTDGERGRCLA